MGLCRYVGPPTAVTVRREVLDMAEIIKKHVEVKSGRRIIESGRKVLGLNPLT